MTITHIQPVSLAKFGGVIGAVFGAVFSVLISISYFLTVSDVRTGQDATQSATESAGIIGTQFPFYVLFSVFTIYTFAGFFLGYMGSVLYNKLSPRFGGIQLRMQTKE